MHSKLDQTNVQMHDVHIKDSKFYVPETLVLTTVIRGLSKMNVTDKKPIW